MTGKGKNQKKKKPTKKIMERNNHRHRHSGLDDAEIIKRQALRSRKLRKLAGRYLFMAMCILAAAMFTFLVWAVINNE